MKGIPGSGAGLGGGGGGAIRLVMGGGLSVFLDLVQDSGGGGGGSIMHVSDLRGG